MLPGAQEGLLENTEVLAHPEHPEQREMGQEGAVIFSF